MNREKAEAFVEAALVELEKCETDADIIAWDDRNTVCHEYIELPFDLVVKLENAYDAKVRSMDGIGA